MKKQKAAVRKTNRKSPSKDSRCSQQLLPVPGLIEHFRERDIRSLPSKVILSVNENGNLVSRPVSEVCGVPLPPDLGKVCGRHASEEAQHMEISLSEHFIIAGRDMTLDIQDEHVAYFEKVILDAVESGFFLALLRYADELKKVPEAAAILEAKRRGSLKGAAARRKQAAPNHKAIRRRFKELAKTIPKATARYLRIGKEFGMHEDSVARIIRGETG
jgi:hypothetical protein